MKTEVRLHHRRQNGLAQLRYALIAIPGRLAAISRERAATRPSPDAWSANEELGHLIDSAANNHQRIVRAQLEDNLALPGYDGDRWVALHALSATRVDRSDRVVEDRKRAPPCRRRGCAGIRVGAHA